jgi:hypothetical protein
MQLRPARLVVAGAAVAYAALTFTAVSAAAEDTGGGAAAADARYYRSSVVAVEPAAPGLTFTVMGSGDSITMENRSGREVVVLGYANEPFLRFTGRGVDLNGNSLTARLNAGRAPSSPAGGDPRTAPAAWQHIGDQPVYAWKDVRVRWAAPERPPVVAQDEHGRHRVFDWALPLSVDGRPTLVRGAVDWVGTPRYSAGEIVTWSAIAVVVLLTAGAAVLARVRPGRRTGAGRPGRRDAGDRTPPPARAPSPAPVPAPAQVPVTAAVARPAGPPPALDVHAVTTASASPGPYADVLQGARTPSPGRRP